MAKKLEELYGEEDKLEEEHKKLENMLLEITDTMRTAIGSEQPFKAAR